MSKIIKEQLLTVISLVVMILLILLIWQFILRPSDDQEPSRSRMVWQGNSIHYYYPTYPLELITNYYA
ncbi:hypothetical protein [Candidatus Contubernalis alkaliaceticus]|uniref:hypothetical protein n=1 Tax=Candidatus Contubernalis alkaliaceticus TaxID=338645 RepID=UPI001F4C0A03|nr:hypothetical protein [Candidatus Contubernalis alkalaceticus]UNC92520.1 hypothetical protein HUE98_10680 [Candidatus Contubernalis alkalaceticus]